MDKMGPPSREIPSDLMFTPTPPSPPDRPVILDVRSDQAFERGHAPGAGHVPASAFDARRTELPPRDASVLVMHDEPQAAESAAEALRMLGYRSIRAWDRPLCEWPDGARSREPAARLWRPSPFVERVRAQLPPGRALDLACGGGRNGVWLALHGWQVEAWDHDEHALVRARGLARRHGVSLDARRVDLECGHPGVPEPRPDVIVVVRYLHRPLLPWLEASLAPGGALVIETFRRGQERHGHPRSPRFLLEPGELPAAMPGLRVEIHEESDPEGGPVLTRYLGRKP